MKTKIKFQKVAIILGIFISFNHLCQGQEIIPLRPTFQDPIWEIKVKQIEDFFDRFNNELKYFQNNVMIGHILEKNGYKKLLENLIEMDTGLVYKEFVNKVSEGTGEKLSFYDKGWYAEVFVKFNLWGKNHTRTLLLEVVEDRNIGYKWMICALGKPDSLLWKLKHDPQKFINPANHNLRFSKIPTYLNSETDFGNLISNKLSFDDQSIFFFLISQGDIIITGIEKIRYHFLQYPDFIFVVEHFERSNPKSGWLISSIKKAGSMEKEDYLTGILNIQNHEIDQ